MGSLLDLKVGDGGAQEVKRIAPGYSGGWKCCPIIVRL
jgi:hypothetical protein